MIEGGVYWVIIAWNANFIKSVLLSVDLMVHAGKRNNTHTHTHTQSGICVLRGLSIGVMFFILYKLYVLLLHLNLALTGDFVHF